MIATLGRAVTAGIDGMVRVVVLPVTGIVPWLVRTGLLFAAFAALWVVFLAALVIDASMAMAARGTLDALPLPVQALAWLLFLPLTAALWAWTSDWPLVVRFAIVIGLAAWNLLTFLPPRGTAAAAPTA